MDEADWVVGRIRGGVVESVTTTRVVLRGVQRVASGRCHVAAFSERGVREIAAPPSRDGFTEVRELKRCRRITGAELQVALRRHPALWR